MENKIPMQAAKELEALVQRVRAEALQLATDKQVPLNGAAPKQPCGFRATVQDPLGGDMATDEAYLSMLRLYAIEQSELVDELYRLLFGREADAQGRHAYQQMLQATGSRLRVAMKLRLSTEGRRKAVPMEAMAKTLLIYGTQFLLRRLGLDILIRGRVKRYENRLRARWSWPALQVRMQAHQQRALQTSTSELDTLKADVNELMAKERAKDGGGHGLAKEIDTYYLAFEEDGRGSLEQVRAKLGAYDDWIATISTSTALPVLDIGCGRGEWLQLLEERGVQAWGIDSSPVMADTCRSKNLEVTCGDALAVIGTVADQTLGALTLFHVVEHLPFPALYILIKEAARVLHAGGSILIETPNPENLLVGSHTFYHDFTHRNPVTPTALQFLLSYHGFERLQVLRLNPYPPEARVPGTDALTERMNGHLCGPQDYAVIGWLPETPWEAP